MAVVYKSVINLIIIQYYFSGFSNYILFQYASKKLNDFFDNKKLNCIKLKNLFSKYLIINKENEETPLLFINK